MNKLINKPLTITGHILNELSEVETLRHMQMFLMRNYVDLEKLEGDDRKRVFELIGEKIATL